MVARCGMLKDVGSSMHGPYHPPADDHRGPPVHPSPPLANYLLTYLEVLGILAEASLMLWLIVMGVNSQRWNERARAAGASIHT
jgi:hypothetical protein